MENSLDNYSHLLHKPDKRHFSNHLLSELDANNSYVSESFPKVLTHTSHIQCLLCHPGSCRIIDTTKNKIGNEIKISRITRYDHRACERIFS